MGQVSLNRQDELEGSKRMTISNGGNTTSIGLEQQIWAAADILRGAMYAAEYKHVVLGLTFLKNISPMPGKSARSLTTRYAGD
jgi:hypothetical protein